MLGLDDVAAGVGEAVGGIWGLGLVAVGAVILAPRAKPLAKQAIKGYLAATERAREMMAETGEQLQDLYAEAKHEYESELSQPQNAEKIAVETGEGDSESEGRPRRRGSASGLVTASGQPA
ncbi:MAG TPA: DUF5132 domain-containing protein [Chloroflexota bacterium]|nr:DUF5132 domain-containing protein [Chloroflexota bacterium]